MITVEPQHSQTGTLKHFIEDLTAEVPGPAKPDVLRNGGSLDSDCTAIAAAVKEGLRIALAEQDELIGYSELARRMRLKEKFVRHLKNAGIIHAALDLGKIVRFHYPSVLEELKRARSAGRCSDSR
jgi:hypothetical protein